MKANKKPIWKRWWVWALGIIVIAVMAGGGDETTPVPTPGQTAPAPAPKQEAPLSNEGVSSNVKIKVEGVQTKSLIATQFSQQKAQGVFKIVKMTITNNQKDAITVDSNSFKLVDDQGREFSYSVEGQTELEMSTNQDLLFLKKLNPGLSLTTNIVFDVPQDVKGLTMKASGGFTGKEIKLKVE